MRTPTPCDYRLNADDFGRSSEVNRAVIRAFREGALASASLMATGDAFDEAVELAAANEGLQVGIHLVTVMGRAVLPHRQLPHITDLQGRFADNPATAGLRYFFSRTARRELFRELEAQFEKLQATGLNVSHVDSHLHMHVHPVIFQMSLSLARRYGVGHMRVPRDDFFMALRFTRAGLPLKALEAFIFVLLTGKMRKTLGATGGISCCDRVYGHFLSGRMTEEYVAAILHQPGRGAFEIYLHPALHDEARSDLSEEELQGVREFRILTSGRITRLMKTLRWEASRGSRQESTP